MKRRSKKQKGKGVVTDVINKVRDFLVPKTLSSKFKAALQRFGEMKIAKITLGKDPVMSMAKKMVNWLSLGEFEQNRKKLGYDDVFHTFMIVTFANGEMVKLEKVAVPSITSTSLKNPAKFSFDLPLGKSILFKDLVMNTVKRMGEEKFVRYDALNNNCQIFLDNILKANGLSSTAATAFFMQDAKALIGEGSTTASVAKALTDMGATVTQLLGGKKKKQKGKGNNRIVIKPLPRMDQIKALMEQKGKGAVIFM